MTSINEFKVGQVVRSIDPRDDLYNKIAKIETIVDGAVLVCKPLEPIIQGRKSISLFPLVWECEVVL
jgi:hypothetical protein